jgi:TP901 family phage tail tape measure protein
MADVNANIDINIDSSNALTQLKALQRQISQFHTSISRSSEAAALAQKGLQKNLLNSINSIGAFSAEMRTVKTSAESFTNSLEKNKFSMREYFRYAGASTKTFGKLFKSEFDTIGKVSEERVKRLQTQYIKMGRDTNGAMQAMAVMPTKLNLDDYTTQVQIAAQKQALFNQLMKQGSTNLLNFGKNTQWAGRQLMVGFTLPLMAVGTAAAKTFMDMEAQAIRFKKVYGDLFTPQEETQQALDNITELGKQFTKYGVAVSTTVGLAAEAAAAGFSGLDLQRQTTEATRLSILGQVDSQKALETTISLQNAFSMSSENLATSIDFLNAVENQTVVSLDDITTAIPKVAPVIQQLGGDVKDLAFFMAAMKEGGINASEGANALKSGLAALINPTGKAADMLKSYGINATAIVENNKGDLKATVIGFAQALNQLDPLARARAIEQMFGKFQFARLSTLFANVARDGNQAARVLDLANSSVEDLAALSEKELGMTAESSMNKFKKAVEDLKVALIPVGQAFLEAATPIVDFVGNILEKFANLSSGTKRFITLFTVGVGAIGPVLLMTFGLLANGVANIIKLFLTLRGGYQRLTGQTNILGEQTQYMTMEQLDAAAAAHSLNQTHATLTQTFTAEATAINKLISAYNSAAGAARNFSMNNPGMMMPGRGARKLASGIVSVPGPKGAGDVVPAMLSPGEAVIPTAMAKKYAPLIQGMIADNIPGYQGGRAKRFFTQSKIDEILKDTGVADDQRLRIPLPISSPSYSVSGVMAPKSVNTTSIGMTKEYLSSPMGRAALDASIQAELEGLGISAERASKVLDSVGPELDTAVNEFDNTIEGWKNASTKAIKQIESSSKLTNIEKSAIRKRIAPINPQDYTVTSDRVLEIKKGKATPRPERKDSAYRAERQKQILKQKGYVTDDLVFAHMPGYEKIEGTQRATMRPPTAASKVLSGAQLAAAEKLRRDYLMNQGISVQEIEKIAREDAEVYQRAINKAAGVESPSKKTRKTGEDLGRGLEEGMRSRQDDVAKVGNSLGTAATKGVQGGVKTVPFRAPGQPGFVAGNAPVSNMPGVSLSEITARARRNREQLLQSQQLKRTQAMNARMNSLNKAFMSGTFALSAFSGVASMAGGNLGKVSEVLFKISGPLFALSSVIQLLTGEKIVGVLRDIGKLKLGLIAVGITALSFGIKLLNNSIEKQRMAIEGFSNALTTTSDKAKFLGDFFGTIPSARAGSQTVFSAAQTSPTERTRIQELKASEEFQSRYKKDIQAFATATNEQVLLGFQTMALDLRGQGFAKEQIDIIIKSLAEESGKTDVLLKFKAIDFDLSKEAGANYASALAKQVADDFSTALPKAIETRGVFRQGAKGQGVKVGEEFVLTPEQKAKINESGQNLSNILTGIQGQFKAGIINAKQYNSIINKTIDGIIPNANAHLLFQSALEKTNPEIAKVTQGMTDANEIALVYQATLVGFTPKLQGLFAALSGARLFEKSGIIEAIRAELLAGEKVLQEIYGAGTGGKTGERELNALEERIKAIKEQTESFKLLRNAKIDEKTATELSNDAAIASLIIKNKSSKLLPKIIAQVKEYSKALKAQASAEKNLAEPSTKFKIQLGELQALANLRDKIIDIQFASRINAENNALKTQEQNLQNVNDAIDKINTTQIKPIQAIIDANNFALEQISLQEDAINEKYNKQIEALDKIATINQDIANIQKQRLSIADALTRGDISAAAQLAQEAKAQQAQTAISRQRDALTSSRDNQLTALGRVVIEKQNRDLQLQISKIERDKLLSLQTQKETIEASIEATNRSIQALNSQVDTLKNAAFYSGKTKEEIDDLAGLIAAAEAAGIEFDNVLLSQAGNAASLAKALGDAVANQKSLSSLSGIVSTASAATAKPTGLFTTAGVGGNKITTPFDTGAGLMRKSMSLGGIVPKYMARGGKIGSDTVPAMLTPGEFVMNKRATQQFGPMLSMLNESKYPSMIGNRSSAQIPVNSISTSMNDNSTAVYNYSLGFNINGSNSNANDIARAVMKEIKNVDSQRIRGQRL